MEAVRTAVLDRARALYRGCIAQGLAQTPAFKGVGMAYVRFAREEPKLFQLLFMTERPDAPDLDSVLPLPDESCGEILASVTAAYPLNDDEAEALYWHLWVYTHGVAVLCAAKVCRFGEAELSRMLTEAFAAFLRKEMGK